MSTAKPSEFFKGNTLLPFKLADYVKKDLGIGPDGTFWLYETGVWKPAPDEVRARMVQVLKNRYASRYVQTVEDSVMHSWELPRIPSSPMDGEKWYPMVNLQNGVYDWKENKRSKHDRAHLHTVQLPFKYDASATCPAFDAWVEEVVSADVQQLFWEVLGYMLMSGNPLQRAFLLHGPAGTGKSTTQRVLEEMLGKANISAVSLRELSEDRFAGAGLFGKIANISGDLDAAYLKNSSAFKKITGDDLISAERKYRDAFSFRNWATPLYSTNKTWRSSDDTDGYFRRWVILPFTHKVDRTKPFDETTLYREAPGIFNKAMANLRVLHDRGDFALYGAAATAQAEFEQDSDPVRLWLAEDDHVSVDWGNTSLRVDRAMLHARYQYWTAHVDGQKTWKAANELYKSLEAMGAVHLKSNGTRYLVGISLYDELTEEQMAWASSRSIGATT